MRRLALILAVALLPAAAAGQQYQPWNNPDGSTPGAGDTARQTLIERLNSLVDEAEKSRAADPAFLSDLRDLARGYERPWRNLVLADDFGDGDFTGNPRWTVTAGRYLVQRGWGLRSIVDAERAAPEQRRLDHTIERPGLWSFLLGRQQWFSYSLLHRSNLFSMS